MAFLGNPGTGKTTVAQIIGKIFASWGILSTGHVIRTEKSQMVGQYIGETEFKMRNLLARAHGNVLFIDEAYQLMVKDNEKDFGRIVMNSLLTELGNDESDMVVILAGYTAPMKQLLESNEGIESRFPNVFNFEDYTTDELVEIAHIMIKEQGLKLSQDAESNLRAIIDEEAKKPSPRFGNGRFVSNLIQNQILATMGSRLASVKDPTVEELVTILPQDVVIGKVHKDIVFDDVAIDGALERLDRLSGLDNVKKAIHNFVQSARYLHSIGEPFVGKGLLAWRFIGKSGTGKSTVAEIMAAILKGMHLIANSNITQLKAERLLSVYPSGIGPILNDTVKRSCNGLIFIDADTSQMGISKNDYANFVETIKLKLEELTVEVGGECALIMAELDAPNKTVAEQFTDSGIYEFDHTLIFKDFTPDELYDILCDCLKRFKISFTPAAETHIKKYIATICSNFDANARTMKLMSRTIHQQVILRESGLTRRPKEHQVQLADIETFKWNSRKGRLGY
jgi:adenylate kinase family enzyme